MARRRAEKLESKAGRRMLAESLNNYWEAFHEVLEAQSVNPTMLAGSLFNELVEHHQQFARSYRGDQDPVEALGRLWTHVAARREDAGDAPLTAREVAHARAQFERIDESLQPRARPQADAALGTLRA